MQRGVISTFKGLGVFVVVAVVSAAAALFSQSLFAADQSRAKELIKNSCASCHRFEGKPDSRFNLRAPDLIWAGSKYQRSWLIGWLTGKEQPLYAKGYRWVFRRDSPNIRPSRNPTRTRWRTISGSSTRTDA